MLETPLGKIKLTVKYLENNEKKDREIIYLERSISTARFKNVDARYIIEYPFSEEPQLLTIKCELESYEDIKSYVESGRMFEAISFYKNSIKVSIGTEGEFEYSGYKTIYDYNGKYLKNAIEISTNEKTKARIFKFIIAWSINADDNDTWQAVNPTFIAID